MTSAHTQKTRRSVSLIASFVVTVSLIVGTMSAPALAAESVSAARSTSVVTAAPETFTATPTPVIVGTLSVGSTLSITTGTWLPAVVSLTYQWQRAGVAIAAANAATYLITSDDLGKAISVRVTGSKAGYLTVTQASTASIPVSAGTLSPTPIPTITGSTVVGASLTAVAGAWGATPVALAYQWFRGSARIAGATTSRYLINASDLGEVLSASVTGTKTGYAAVTRTSAKTVAISAAVFSVMPVPTISGTAIVGQILTASPETWSLVPDLFSYQWNRNDLPISGAPQLSSYTLTNADAGSRITVTVTGTRAGFEAVSRTSAPSAVVLRALTTTPIPALAGVARVASTLTATAGVWGPGDVALSYRWKRGSSVISGANSATYTLAPADLGKIITVSVVGSRDGYASVTQTSLPSVAVAPATLSRSPIPTVTGRAIVGETLTAQPGTWAPSPVTLSYQWLRGAVAISGARAASYSLVAADKGMAISVTVTGSQAGYTSVSRTSSVSTAVLAGVLSSTPTPTISGSAVVGSVLTATSAAWAPATVTLSYVWKRDAVVISGATRAAYTLTGAELGAEITVIVTGSKAGYTSVTTSSESTVPVIVASFTRTAVPLITGVASVGQSLVADPGAWSPVATTLTYRWLRDGTPIAGATTGATYLVSSGDVGSEISVTLTGSRPGYATLSFTSAPSDVVLELLTATPRPTLSGTATVGQTLTATSGTWRPATVGLTYRWKRGAVVIGGADAATYLLTPSDAGKAITVTVTGTKTGFTPVSMSSAATALVAQAALTSKPVPTISGTARVGSTLTATAGTWRPSPVSLSYQWKRDTVAISGANSASYLLAIADAGALITVTVTGAKDGYSSVAKTSAASAAVAGAELTASPVPTVAGTLRVGQLLTGTPGTWGPAPVALAYQWYRGSTAIIGATSSAYALVVGDAGKAIKLTVTGSKDGYAAVSRTSVPTAPIEASSLSATPTPIVQGTPALGSSLSVVTGTWLPAVVALSYQWKRDGEAISGATAATYAIVAADVGFPLSVAVTGTKTGYTTTTVTSAATVSVAPAPFTTTPTPTVTGTRTVGSTLTGATTAWAPTPSVMEYQWLRDGEPILDATELTYLLSADDAATVVTFSVTATRLGYTTATRVSATGTAIPGQAFSSTEVPLISGTVVVGETLTVDPGAWDPVPDSFTYVWKRGVTVIADETTDTYVLTGADLGARITVTATAILTQYNATSTVSAATVAVAAGTLVVDTVPTITGDPTTGQVLTVDPGIWLPDSVTFTYAWMRDGAAISPAKTLATYTVVVADEGHELTVVVTGRATGYTNLPVTTDPVSPVVPTAFDTAPVPEVTGDAIVGESLIVDAGAWDPVPDSLSYVWKRGGVAITPAATDTSYLLTSADAGSTITVTVTAVLATYATTSTTSVATASVLRVLTATPIPTITGTLAVDSLLTAVAGTWSPSPVGLTYEWLNNGTPIDSATSASYRLVGADLDALITVAVTGTKTGYVPVTQTSIDSDPVAAGTFTTTPTPTIAGAAIVGETLTADVGIWDPVPDSFSYVWKRGASVIADEVTDTYVLVGADAGFQITVVATATTTGYDAASTTSEPTSAVLDVFAETPTPTISGTEAVGELLTADAGTWLPAPVELSYSWFRDGELIEGESASTYRLIVEDLGAVITVAVTGTKSGFVVDTKTSAPTGLIAEGAFSSTAAPTITGVAASGETLDADIGMWNPTDGTPSYQWFRDSVAITDEIGASYTLVDADLGTTISVTVTLSKTGYRPAEASASLVIPAS